MTETTIDLTKYAGRTPGECITCMPAHCETCPDHVEAVKRLEGFPLLLAEVERLRNIETDRNGTMKVNKGLVDMLERLESQRDKLTKALENIKWRAARNLMQDINYNHEGKPSNIRTVAHAALAKVKGDDNNDREDD